MSIRNRLSRWLRDDPARPAPSDRRRRSSVLRVEALEDRTNPDNTLGTATNLGVLAGSVTASGFVGASDLNDFYRFNLSAAGRTRVELTGLSADADIQLIRDANRNGVVNPGDVLASSANGGSASELINSGALAAGTYFVRVYRFAGNTNYDLRVTADYAGNTLATARALGTRAAGPATFADWVGAADADDFYRFALSSAGTVRVGLTGLSADADLQLIRDANGNRVVDAGDVLASSANGGSASELISSGELAAGTYYVRVYQFSGNTNYTLSLDPDYAGNTLGTARQLGTLAAGTRTFADYAGNGDADDFYRFALSNPATVSLRLTGLSADIDLQLIRDANGNGVVNPGDVLASSTNGGNAAEAINFFDLGAGTYFVRVYPFTAAGSRYSLALTTTYAGNTLRTARNLGPIAAAGTRTLTDFVGSSDRDDFVRFTFSAATYLTVRLTGLSADADLQLIRDANGNGVVNPGDVLASSTNGGSASELISRRLLAAGTYYVRVYQFSGDTNYNLGLTFG